MKANSDACYPEYQVGGGEGGRGVRGDLCIPNHKEHSKFVIVTLVLVIITYTTDHT